MNSGRSSVLDRLRISQKVLDKKNRIYGRNDVSPDDGDHGFDRGFVKRKGMNDLS